jgi:hypothetical protein
MIFEVRLRPEAELDLADAALWYEACLGVRQFAVTAINLAG